jgi:predicted PurR-regulated permease PerM
VSIAWPRDPNIGPIISAIPAVLLGWMISPEKALHVVALYVGIQAVESYVLTPLIQRKTIELPPALTLSSQVLLGTVFGLLGVALATPLMAAGIVVTKLLYVEDRLHKNSAESA